MRNVTKITIIALVVVTMIGATIGISLALKENNSPDVVVLHKGLVQVEKDVHLVDMAPGEPETMTLRFEGEQGKTYRVQFGYRAEAAELAPYVHVQFVHAGDVLAEAPLEELVNGKTVEIQLPVIDSNLADLDVIYTMGLDVGNEAQGKRADLAITILGEEQ